MSVYKKPWQRERNTRGKVKMGRQTSNRRLGVTGIDNGAGSDSG